VAFIVLFTSIGHWPH